jgi:hypothetical protein
MSRAGSRTLQRSLREIASEAIELSAVKHTRDNGEAVVHVMRFTVPHNAAVERRRDKVSSAPRVHNEMAHMRRARDAV